MSGSAAGRCFIDLAIEIYMYVWMYGCMDVCSYTY